MPYVNIKITKEGATAEQKAELIKGVTGLLENILGKQKNGKRMRLMGYHPTRSFGGRKKLTNPKYKKETGYTVKSFMEQHPKGNYFMIVKGHALALVDGILYGNSDEQYNGFRRQVHYVIKCQ